MNTFILTLRHFIRKHPVLASLLILLVIAGSMLRLYHVGEFMHFSEDESRDAFLVRSIARDGDIQLLGPTITNTDKEVHLGPFFYYLLVPGYLASSFNPSGGAWTVAILSIVSIGLLVFLLRKLTNTFIALTAGFLYAVSWLPVFYGRWQWNPNVVPVFTLFLLVCLYNIISSKNKNRTWWYYALACTTGLLLQLHTTALYILPVFLVVSFFVFNIKLSWKQHALALTIFLFTNIPYIVYEFTHNFVNSKGFIDVVLHSGGESQDIIWRVKHTLLETKAFIGEAVFRHELSWIVLTLVFFGGVFLLYKAVAGWENRQKNPGWVLLALWLGIPCVIFLFFTGKMYPHYFSVIFPFPYIALAICFYAVSKVRYLKYGSIALVAAAVIFALYQPMVMLNDLSQEGMRRFSHSITLEDLDETASYVVSVAEEQHVPIRVIPGHYFRSIEYLVDERGKEIIPSETPEYLVVLNSETINIDQSLLNHLGSGKVFSHISIFPTDYTQE